MKATFFSSAAIAAIAIAVSPVLGSDLRRIVMCVGPDGEGPCINRKWTLGECHKLPEPFYENINTFLPDDTDFGCFPRTYDCGEICTSPTGCTFGEIDNQYEHAFNLSAIGWNKIFKSFDCHELHN